MQIGRGLMRRMAMDGSLSASVVPGALGASFLPQLQLAECEVTASGPVIEDFLIAGGPGVVKTRPAYQPGEPAVGLARGKTQVAGRYLEQCRLLIDPGSNFGVRDTHNPLAFRTMQPAISSACNSDRGQGDGIVSAGFGNGHAGFGIPRGVARQGDFARNPNDWLRCG